jgi:hypothetical protein
LTKDNDTERAAAHTPGPWCVNDTHGGRYIETKSEDAVAQVFRSKRYLADARLIAAAPDLLEALRLMLRGTQADCGRVCMPNDDAVRAAFAAIAKATGSPA